MPAILATALFAVPAACPTSSGEDFTIEVLITTGVQLGEIGEMLTVRDAVVDDEGNWFLELDTVTNGSTGIISGDQMDPVLLSNEGIVTNRLDPQPGPTFFPELTGPDPEYLLTTIEQIAVTDGQLATFITTDFLTPLVPQTSIIARGYTFGGELMLLDDVPVTAPVVGSGVVDTSSIRNALKVLADGRVVTNMSVRLGAVSTDGVYVVDPEDPTNILAAPFVEGSPIPGIGTPTQVPQRDSSVSVSPGGKMVLPVNISGTSSVNNNGRLVFYDPQTEAYTLLAEEGGSSPVEGQSFIDFMNSPTAVNDAGDWFLRGFFNAFEPGLGGTVFIRNNEVFLRGLEFIEVDGHSLQLISTISPTGALDYYLSDDGELLWLGEFVDEATPFEDRALFYEHDVLLRENVTMLDGVTFPDVVLTHLGNPTVTIPGGTFDDVPVVEIGAGLQGFPGFLLPNDGLEANSYSMSPNGRFIIVEVGLEHPVNQERLAAALLIDRHPGGLPADSLQVDTETLSLSAGGAQNFLLDAGSDFAGELYVLGGSMSGTTPGFPLGAVVLPLNFDSYSLATLVSANDLIQNSFSLLDGAGSSAAALVVPAGTQPSLVGVTLNHAYAVLAASGAAVFASNAVSLSLAP
ncbi:MAG: hypothetical protein AAF682_08150 [Planctomycetota bacterium]